MKRYLLYYKAIFSKFRLPYSPSFQKKIFSDTCTFFHFIDILILLHNFKISGQNLTKAFICIYTDKGGFPSSSVIKNPPAMQEMWVLSLDQEDSWRRAWQPTPVFLPGEPHGQRSLAGYSPWGCKELDTPEQLSTHSYT